MTAGRRIRLPRYLLPPLLVGAAHLLTRLLWPVMEGNLSLLFLTAVMVSALHGGLLAGLLASVLAGLTSAIFYYPPEHSVLIDFDDLLRTIAFVAVAIFVSWLSGARRRWEEALRESQAALERRVEERTAELRLANERLEGEVAERKRAESQIMAYQERLRSATAELSMSEERQRRQIAATLHDAVGHRLAVAVMKLRGLLDEDVSGRAPEIVRACELIEQAIGHTRSLTLQLSPPVLYELGLEAAVEWLAEEVEAETGLAVTVEDDGLPKPTDDQVRSLVFSSVRELLVNVVKHARARTARVSIGRDGNHVRVTVADDGIGCDGGRAHAAAPGSSGFGLFNIRERLSHLGGRFDLDAGTDGGCRATLVAPLTSPSKLPAATARTP
jgi:signal transduction histidine kinase